LQLATPFYSRGKHVTLTIHIEEDTQRQMSLTIELDEARVTKAMRDKARELARDFNFPGFRPGRAPYHVVARRLGEDALRAEAIEELVQPTFEEALDQLEEQGVELYGSPQLDDIDLENQPVVLKFTLPLQPTVKLGDYRALRKEIEPVQISEEAVEEALESVREVHQEVETVDRPAEMGDLVILSGKGKFLTPRRVTAAETPGDEAPSDESSEPQTAEQGTESEPATAAPDKAEAPADSTTEVALDSKEVITSVDVAESDVETADAAEDSAAGQEVGDEAEEEDIIFDNERMELLLDSKRLFSGTPFVDEVVGMAAGDEKTFSFTFPEDYEEEDMAGREATFTVTPLEVKKRELPPLDDELAKLEGNYETLDELRAGIRKDLERAAQNEQRNTVLEEMVDDLLAEAEMVYPPAAVNLVIDDMVDEFKRQLQGMGWQMQDYMQLQGLTDESLRNDFRESAETRLRRQLALRQFVLDEKLRVESADIDAVIDERVSRFDNEELQDGMRNFYKSGRGFESVSSEALGNKTYERIAAILSGNAPDLATLDTVDEILPAGLDEEE
jgi:trigger factor